MTILFAGNEWDSIRYSAGLISENFEVGQQYRKEYNRGAMRTRGTFKPLVFSQTSNDVWFHFVMRFQDPEESVPNPFLVVYDENNVACFRVAMEPNYSPYCRLSYFDGSAWIDSTKTIYIDDDRILTLDIHFKSGGDGICEFYNEGALMDSLPVATQPVYNMANAVIDTPSNATAYPVYISELLVADEATTGWAVEYAIPTAAGTDVTGTGTAADIDDEIIDTAALSIAAGGQMSFTSAARDAEITIVRGVAINALAYCDPAGTAQGCKLYLKIGGVRYYSPRIALTAEKQPVQYVWETNPVTGAEWTVADAQAAGLEWGIEAVA